MVVFLHSVLYMPNPKIMVAKTTNGIKIKILVLRPMFKMK